MPHYSEQQIEAANSTSLVAFLQSHGEQLKKFGLQYLWEKHQVWIRDNRWYTHYEAEGGYAITFVMKYYAMGFQEAIAELIGNGVAHCSSQGVYEQKPKELVIPKANTTMNRVYAYLMNERFISRDVISFFAHDKKIYEDEKYHNCIFVGHDENGKIRHIHRRSTHGTFKQTETGSKAEYSFHHDGKSEWIFVFEAPIDMLAFINLHQNNWAQHSYVALCSVSERSLLHRLKVNPYIKKIVLCLDHDNAGIAACKRIRDILLLRGYSDVRMLHSINKDWDEDIKALNGVLPIKAEADDTEIIRNQCKKYIANVSNSRPPKMLIEKINTKFNTIKKLKTNISLEQVEEMIYLLLILSKDECRKCLKNISWERIEEMLVQEYVPHTDNGNLEIRVRQLITNLDEALKVYEIPTMFNDETIFVRPLLRATMDCIRIIKYLNGKEKSCKESKP